MPLFWKYYHLAIFNSSAVLDFTSLICNKNVAFVFPFYSFSLCIFNFSWILFNALWCQPTIHHKKYWNSNSTKGFVKTSLTDSSVSTEEVQVILNQSNPYSILLQSKKNNGFLEDCRKYLKYALLSVWVMKRWI